MVVFTTNAIQFDNHKIIRSVVIGESVAVRLEPHLFHIWLFSPFASFLACRTRYFNQQAQGRIPNKLVCSYNSSSRSTPKALIVVHSVLYLIQFQQVEH